MAKRLRILAGPNGSGKTSIYKDLRDEFNWGYTRSMEQLSDAILLSDRAYVFDNSGMAYEWIAEYDGTEKQLKVFQEKDWLEQYVLKN